MLIGRRDELQELDQLRAKNTSSLVVVHGRRRIGKRALLSHYGQGFRQCYEFQGLGPREGLTRHHQLENFATQLRQQFGLGPFHFDDWSDAFSTLAKLAAGKECLIILDEISWMASYDPDFAGKLKIAWDTEFKKNPRLILALCGSVSSWIEKNILSHGDFVGRISYTKNLQPLKLGYCAEFWGHRQNRMAPLEILTTLCVTGGIPKYLEEIDTSSPAMDNIRRLCFSPGGYLFQDFERIFNDIFSRRSSTYKKILSHIVDHHLEPKLLAKSLKISQSGDLTEYLEDMRQAGFIARDFNWDFGGRTGKLSHYRIRDNYLRFYLRYVEPRKAQIEKGLFKFVSLDGLTNWNVLRGLQFENLILDNVPELCAALNIDLKSLQEYGPYFQTKTKRRAGCQIDLLIQDRFKTLYVCEIKIRRRIDLSVIAEVGQKIERLERPKGMSVRPVLIYAGEIDPEVAHADFFDRVLDATQLLHLE